MSNLTITNVLCCICNKMRKVKFFDNWPNDRLCKDCVKLFEKYPKVPIEKMIDAIRDKKIKELLK